MEILQVYPSFEHSRQQALHETYQATTAILETEQPFHRFLDNEETFENRTFT